LGISWIVITNELIKEMRKIWVRRLVYLIMKGLYDKPNMNKAIMVNIILAKYIFIMNSWKK
jgi:hypothetical protein